MIELYRVIHPERHTINCGHCGGKHGSKIGVRHCHAGAQIHSCPDMVRTNEYTEDGELCIFECLADAWNTPRGSQCARGHEHVNAEARMREGWDYAADADEAHLLRQYGVDAVAMNGGSI